MILNRISFLIFTVAMSVSTAHALKQNYCAEGTGETVLFLIDRTSVFDEQDKTSFADGVGILFKQLKSGERLIMHTLTEDFADSRKIFDACRPGCKEQGVVSGLFSQCKASRAKVDERKYIREVLTSVKPLIENQEKYPNSEIIETIAFMMQEYEHHKPARLVIFSDMIEHSRVAKFGHLKQKNIESLLDKLEKLDLIRPMKGVAVEVFGYGRDHSAQRHGLKAELKRNIEDFWQQYFRRAGVSNFHLGRNLSN